MLPIAALLALVLIAAFFLARRRRARQALRYSNLAFLIAAAQPPQWPRRALAAIWIAAALLVALSLVGPRASVAVPVRDGALMLCVDTSGSMAATDVTPTRAQAASAAMRAFIEEVPAGVAVGIVSFAGDAQLVQPPSRNRDAVLAALDRIPPPNGATAIGDAVLLAARAMPKSGTRAIVLITDGENNAGSDPMQAAQQLAAARIRLYTVGIGTNAGALVPGTLQTAGLDEDALRAYAQATGGSYSRAGGAQELRAALARLGRTTGFERRPVDLSHAAALAGALLAAMAFLSGAWTKSI